MTEQTSINKWELGIQGALVMDCSLEEEIAITGNLGYDYLEIRDWKLETFLETRSMEDLHRQFEECGVKPLNMAALELGTLGPGPDRDKMKERYEWYFRMVRETGCKSVEFVHFSPSPDELSAEQVKQQVVDDVRYLSDLAGKYNAIAIYEFLGSEQLPIHNIADTMEILERANCENVEWVFDFYQFHVGDKSFESLANCNVQTMGLVHIADVKDLPYEELAAPKSERLLPGDGVCPTKEILKSLHRIGYRGPFVIELYNPEFTSMRPDEFARVAKEKTLAVLDKYFNSERWS